MKIRLGADTLVELVAPIDQGATPPAPLTSATVSAVLVDTARETVLDANASFGVSVISVESARRFEPWHTVLIEMGTASIHESALAGVDIAAGTLTLQTPPTFNCQKGARVSVKVGATITLAGFNLANANVETTDWGYRGEIQPNHNGLGLAQTVRVEITASQGGRVAREWFDAAIERPGA